MALWRTDISLAFVRRTVHCPGPFSALDLTHRQSSHVIDQAPRISSNKMMKTLNLTGGSSHSPFVSTRSEKGAVREQAYSLGTAPLHEALPEGRKISWKTEERRMVKKYMTMKIRRLLRRSTRMLSHVDTHIFARFGIQIIPAGH